MARKLSSMSSSALERESLLNRITTRIRRSLELQEILTTTAREIRSFLNTDRVKIYQFEPDGSGKVIAESIKNKSLPSLLGLHFPATDIPPHARELFIKARQRVIVDVNAKHQTINRLDCPDTGESLLIEDIRYYPADPCHIEYLTAMGVRSSFTVPILHQNQLWGLLVSHHAKTRRFSERDLKIVQLLVDQLSIAIAQAHLLSQARQQARDEAIINQISSLLHSPLELTEIRQTVLEKTVKALDGCGGRLYITSDPMGHPAQLYLDGLQPNETWIEEHLIWQQMMGLLNQPEGLQTTRETLGDYEFLQAVPAERNVSLDLAIYPAIIPHLYHITDLYKEPQLKPLYPAFRTVSIRSILVIPLQYHQQTVGCLTIFRSEIETETLWAGRLNPDERNQRPRQSFQAWKEVKKGLAKEWNLDELKLAKAIGIHLYMAVMQRRVERMIRHQASHDQLTGLANRLLFNERLSLALANAHQRGEMLAVVFLDLDGFKNINDTLGHAVGDQLLKSVAHRLMSCLTSGDTIARWGGDEFTLLLSHINSPEDATKICQQILLSLAKSFHCDDRELHIKASLGIAISPYDGEDAETLLKNADAAMYRAKQLGRNNYQLYTPSIGSKAFERMILENNLYKALELKEFLLHYQPKMDLATGTIVGMEALLRWQHPELGLIPPSQFIPLAEETGLICPIGEWVLRTACQQNRAWQLAGLPPMQIAVNLSARQFQQPSLVKTIVQILEETQLSPQYLELEITESIAVKDMEFTTSVLRQLRNQDIQISMDDFGTGYSSLSSLKHLPLDSLKIDRSFVRDLTRSVNDAAIIKVVVALGHGLNLKVVAEGVETLEQLKFLQSLNCDGAQGYLFSKPLSPQATTELCLQNQVSLSREDNSSAR